MSAPSSTPRSIAFIVFCKAYWRTRASLLVNAPSRKTGSPNRFVVAIGTLTPESCERLFELADDLVALGGGGVARNEIVVVQVHAVGAELTELADDLVRRDRWTNRIAEWVAAGIADGPEAKREVVLGFRSVVGHFSSV